MQPLLSMRAGGMRWVNITLVVLAIGSIVAGVGAALAWPDEATDIWITVVTFLITYVFIYVILPQRYEVWPERLSLVFPFWRWNVSYDSIAEVAPAKWWQPYGFMGYRFATNPAKAIVIYRRNGNLFTRPNIVISPVDRDALLRAVHEVMRASGNPPT